MNVLSKTKMCYLLSEVDDVLTNSETKNDNSDPENNEDCICEKCGKRIPKTANHCPYCGSSVGGIKTQNSILKNKKFLLVAGAILFVVILAIILIPSIEKSSKYKNAINELESGDYAEASVEFDQLRKEGYKYSEEYYLYSCGLMKFECNDYDSAISAFEEIYDFKDSTCYISLIEAMKDMSNGDYESAYSTLDKISDFNNASEYKKYCEGYIALDENDYSSAKGIFNDLLDSNLPEGLINESGNIVALINGIEKFNNDDFTCKSDFESVAESETAFVADKANNYLKFIEGKDFFDQGLFYSAYKCFGDCKDIKNVSEYKNMCFQERPASGVVYRNTTSKSVSVIIYDTKDEDDMFVKIYDTNDNLIETMYIRDGGNATASFQSGTFRMAIAYGDPEWWFGTEEAYGTYGSYKRLLLTGNEEYYTFQANNAYSLKFNVSNGNVNDRKSSYGDF